MKYLFAVFLVAAPAFSGRLFFPLGKSDLDPMPAARPLNRHLIEMVSQYIFQRNPNRATELLGQLQVHNGPNPESLLSNEEMAIFAMRIAQNADYTTLDRDYNQLLRLIGDGTLTELHQTNPSLIMSIAYNILPLDPRCAYNLFNLLTSNSIPSDLRALTDYGQLARLLVAELNSSTSSLGSLRRLTRDFTRRDLHQPNSPDMTLAQLRDQVIRQVIGDGTREDLHRPNYAGVTLAMYIDSNIVRSAPILARDLLDLLTGDHISPELRQRANQGMLLRLIINDYARMGSELYPPGWLIDLCERVIGDDGRRPDLHQPNLNIVTSSAHANTIPDTRLRDTLVMDIAHYIWRLNPERAYNLTNILTGNNIPPNLRAFTDYGELARLVVLSIRQPPSDSQEYQLLHRLISHATPAQLHRSTEHGWTMAMSIASNIGQFDPVQAYNLLVRVIAYDPSNPSLRQCNSDGMTLAQIINEYIGRSHPDLARDLCAKLGITEDSCACSIQ